MLKISICGYVELFDPSIPAHCELERIFADTSSNKKLVYRKMNTDGMIECYINERDPVCPMMMLRIVDGSDITLEMLNSSQAYAFAVDHLLDKSLIDNLVMFSQQSQSMDKFVEYGKNREVI